MVSAAVIVEGALDVLSAATLMQLAENSLPIYVNNAIVLFCLLELVNAGQCFALPCLLSGGHDDTPKDLVKYNACLRCARGFIDLGTIVLRVVLWVQYDAVSSVFLVKNLYNLIHTATQVDRYSGVRYYPDVSVCCMCGFVAVFCCCCGGDLWRSVALLSPCAKLSYLKCHAFLLLFYFVFFYLALFLAHALFRVRAFLRLVWHDPPPMERGKKMFLFCPFTVLSLFDLSIFLNSITCAPLFSKPQLSNLNTSHLSPSFDTSGRRFIRSAAFLLLTPLPGCTSREWQEWQPP